MVVFLKTFLFEKLFKLVISVAKLKRLSKEKSGKFHFFFDFPSRIQKNSGFPSENHVFSGFSEEKLQIILPTKTFLQGTLPLKNSILARETPYF